MADLDSFFAKKKDKKKKTVVKVDDVGSLLERKAKKQEEREREEADDQKNGEDDRSQEESEWLDYETNTNNRVDGLRIKDMILEDTEEEAPEVVEGEEKEVVKEVTKTWGTVEKNETAPELIPTASEFAAAKSSRYIAPSMRGQMGGGKIDLTNQEMFPTFAAAEQIEKHKKDEVKSTAWSTAGAPPSRPGAYVPPRTDAWSTARPAGGTRERDDALAAVRAMSATAAPQPIRPPHPVEPVLKKAPNAYVPPHLRNQS